MEHLTLETFKQKIFNWEENSDWTYKGERPAIIDFYADWCGPCKMVGPVLEELSREYAGKVDIYKVNTEEEQALAGFFQIRSIPSLLFIPLTGKPSMAMGALPKKQFEDIIANTLLQTS